jgi:hypothetical protein
MKKKKAKKSKKKIARKQAAVRSKAAVTKRVGRSKRKTRLKRGADTAAFSPQPRARSGRQAGDLQGLSGAERADSESVDELLEEGNAFEADVVAGVEAADDADEKEVRTHEVPEDDVPDEYLDKD